MSGVNVQVKDISAVIDASKEIEAKENTLNNYIKELLSKKQELETRFSQLNCSLPDFNLLQSNAVNLSNIVELTSDIGSELSGKVRKLDIVKSRVLQCVAKLDGIIDLKSAAAGVSTAFQNGCYEEAAEYIQKYLDTDVEIVNLAEKVFSDESAQKAVSTLKEYQEKLHGITCERFDEAVTANDRSALERFSRIFPRIGFHQEGLNKFSRHLCSLVSKKGESLLKLSELSTSSCETPVHVDLLTEILEYAAEVLQTNESLIETAYGLGCLLSVVSLLQTDCDRLVGLVLDRFRSRHNLSDLLRTVRTAATSAIPAQSGGLSGRSTTAAIAHSSGSAGSDLQLDAAGRFKQTLAMEPIISEIVLLNTRAELYLRFVRRRTMTDIARLALEKSDEEKRMNEVSSFFNNCEMVRQQQDLTSIYISLEDFYLREMVIKAAASDEVDAANRIYRFADDVFFVLKKCITRSLSSGSVDSVCAVLNQACSVLLDHLVTSSLAPRIRAGFPSERMQDAYKFVQAGAAAVTSSFSLLAPSGMTSVSSAAALSSLSTAVSGGGLAGASATANGPSETGATTASGQAMTWVAAARLQFLTTLNTLEACLTNLNSLAVQVEREILAVYGAVVVDTASQSSKTNISKLQACLGELKQSLSERIQRLVDSGFEQLSNGVVHSQVEALSLASVRYTLTEDQLDEYTVNDPWVEAYITSMDVFLKPFRDGLSLGNNDQLISIMTSQLVLRLEQLVQKKKFTRFGAIQLGKELRCLFAYLTSVSEAPLRDNFTRLLQLCNLLNLDKVEEVSFYWSTSSWRFSSSEVRKLLALRVDFTADSIRRLNL